MMLTQGCSSGQRNSERQTGTRARVLLLGGIQNRLSVEGFAYDSSSTSSFAGFVTNAPNVPRLASNKLAVFLIKLEMFAIDRRCGQSLPGHQQTLARLGSARCRLWPRRGGTGCCDRLVAWLFSFSWCETINLTLSQNAVRERCLLETQTRRGCPSKARLYIYRRFSIFIPFIPLQAWKLKLKNSTSHYFNTVRAQTQQGGSSQPRPVCDILTEACLSTEENILQHVKSWEMLKVDWCAETTDTRKLLAPPLTEGTALASCTENDN